MNVITKLFEGFKQVRIVILNGITWFVAMDICDILEYKDYLNILARDVKDSDKNSVTICHGIPSRGNPNMTVITQEGVLDLCLHSRMPRAKEFQYWITHNVVPEIMSTGMYITPEKANEMSNDPRYNELLAERDMYLAERNHYKTQLTNIQNQNAQLQDDLYEAQHKYDFIRPDGKKTLYALLDDDNNILVRAIKNNHRIINELELANEALTGGIHIDGGIEIGTLAKIIWNTDTDIGRNRLMSAMRHDGYIIKVNNGHVPSQKSIEDGLMVAVESNGYSTVLITPLGQRYFINKYKNLRV